MFAVQVYGWSTCVDPIIKELVQTLKDTTDLPVRDNPYSWDPLDSTDDKTLFILLVPQTVSTYPMYYVAYQTEQWGTFFLDEGSTSWGMPRGTNETANYKQACLLCPSQCAMCCMTRYVCHDSLLQSAPKDGHLIQARSSLTAHHCQSRCRHPFSWAGLPGT